MLVLVFYLGEVMYITKYGRVKEISPMVKLKQAPHTPNYFAGFLNYRGALAPVIDLRRLIHNEPCRMRLSTRIILLDYRGSNQPSSRIFGLIAERVTETARIADEAFVPTGIAIQEAPYFSEMVVQEQEIIQCLDFDLLIEKFEFLFALQH